MRDFVDLLRLNARATAPTDVQCSTYLRTPVRRSGPGKVNALIAETSIAQTAAMRFAIGLKDIFALPGHRPQGGTLLPLNAPFMPGPVVRNLLKAGAHIVAILNMDELAAGGSGENKAYGRCLNPWHIGHLSGGSSGGSAAAVASGVVPMALGSDTGGSIRIPAAWCGVTGHKPTYGLVPAIGTLVRSPSMDCIGPIARDAVGCARVLEVISGGSLGPMGEARRTEPLRMAMPPVLDVATDPAVRNALSVAADVFASLGVIMVSGPTPDFASLNRSHQIIVHAEAAHLYAHLILENPGVVQIDIEQSILSGRHVSKAEVDAASAGRRDALTRFLADVLGDADVLLLPVTPTLAPEFHGHRDAARRMGEDATFTRFANYLGLPATAFPIGLSKRGLPIAAQLVGRPFADMQCLSAVQAYQEATAYHLQRPPLWVGED